ncbi:protein spire, partial [Halyomorpha halys]|uniref:protein spire n=1 Tax=Halyomorpha halys TaxID=286706 RepID=UPI0034D17946
MEGKLFPKNGPVELSSQLEQAPNDDEDPPDAVTEQSVVAGLGLVIYKSLDYGMEDDEERHLSPELSRLIKNMIGQGAPNHERISDERHHHQENEENDEGIEWDSGYLEDEEANHSSSLAIVIQDSTVHLGCGGAQEADSHYKAVCRALVAEALELSTFLQNVGTGQLRQKTTEHLDKLNFTDWSNMRIWRTLQARLWVQVVRELRRGVQLKKVCYTRKPIEFELTPYEILMDDIRSRRYKLNKVMVDGNIPHKVKKDAHAVILEFIRSRPPLRKASERKLNPPRCTVSSPRELLLESIKQGQVHLKPSPVHRNSRLGQGASRCGLGSNGDATTPGRRLIKVDSSLMNEDSDDDEEPEEEPAADSNPWQRT